MKHQEPHTTNDLTFLQELLRQFVHDRDWEQFHTPRNMILALMGEVGELAELFQWLSDEKASTIMRDPVLAGRVQEELADVFSYVLRLSDVLGINLGKALTAKIRVNAQRYPVERARGNATKYTDFVD